MGFGVVEELRHVAVLLVERLPVGLLVGLLVVLLAGTLVGVWP